MSEIESYLKAATEAGLEKSDGQFTLSGEAARRTLAESVPERMQNPFAAVACLVLAARDLGLSIRPLPDYDWDMDERRVVKLLSRNRAAQEEYVDTLLQAYENPFQSTQPLHRKLSRAIIILEQQGQSFSLFQFKVGRKDFPHTQEDRSFGGYSREPRRIKADPSTLVIAFWKSAFNSESLRAMPGSRRLSRILAHHRAYYQFSVLYAIQNRCTAEPPNILGFRTQRDSLWTKLASRDVYTQTQLCPHTDWYYDRVSRDLIVLEYLVPTEQASPLIVASSQVGETGLVLKPGKTMSSWDRVRSQAENLILHYTTPTEELALGEDLRPKKVAPGTPMKAIFTVGLSEAPSRVAFLSDDTACELSIIPDLPAGLAAAVFWPGLKTDLYGEGWIRNDTFEQALAWVQNMGRNVFRLLVSESEYIKDMVNLDHARRSYRTEVRKRIGDWLDGSQGA